MKTPKNAIKLQQNLFGFLDNCIWISTSKVSHLLGQDWPKQKWCKLKWYKDSVPFQKNYTDWGNSFRDAWDECLK